MKAFSVLAALALAVVANAQAPTLPDCAQSCASQFLAGGIGNCGSDPKCICSNSQFLGDIACCLAKPGGCSTSEQEQAVNFARTFCQAQGVTNLPTAVSCVSSTTSAPTAAATGATNGTFTTSRASTSSSTGFAARATAAPGAAAGVLGGLFAAVAML